MKRKTSPGVLPKHPRFIALVIFILLLPGCGTFLASKDIQRSSDRLSEAIQRTREEQLLRYIVAMRFGRTSGMLRVAQINSQITWGAGIGGHWGTNAVGTSVTPGVHYSEAPTITYTPVTGSDYVNMWLSPISMQTLLVTINGGWDIETMFKVAVQGIGELTNGYSGSINQYKNPPQFEKFYRCARLLGDLADKGFLKTSMLGNNNFPIKQWNIEKQRKAEGIGGLNFPLPQAVQERTYQTFDSPLALNFDRDVLDKSCPAHAAFMEVLELLNLDINSLKTSNPTYPDRIVIILQCATFPSFAVDVKVNTRSMEQIMYNMSWAVDIPPEIIEKGWVFEVPTAAGEKQFDFREMFDQFFHVQYSKKPDRPRDAAIAVEFEGNWYYIAHSDCYSKRSFSLLLQLATMQSGIQNKAAMPTLTIGLQ